MHYQHGTWSPIVLQIQGNLQSISMVSATDGWAVGQTNGIGALILHYDGQSWKQVFGPTNSDTARVQMLSATVGWAVGNDSILHYDGQSWQHQALPTSLGAGTTHSVSLLGISMLSVEEGWAVGFIMPILNSSSSTTTLPDGIILHYSSGQWRVQQQLHHVTLSGIAMLSENDGWIAGRTEALTPSNRALTPSNSRQAESVSPLLLHYSDGQWVQASQPLAGTDGELGEVVMLSPTDGWINANGQYMLQYNGTLWSMVSLPKAPTSHGYFLTGLSMLSSHEGWAAGSLFSDADQGIPSAARTYQPTITPILLHYLDGDWSIFGG
jgi:hypothetical protein